MSRRQTPTGDQDPAVPDDNDDPLRRILLILQIIETKARIVYLVLLIVMALLALGIVV